MRIRNLLLLGAGLAIVAAPAFADLNYTEGSGKVIFDFICFTTKHCSAHTPINSAGTEIFTSATPGQVTGANGTFPASQSGTWTVQPGNTANTTAWKVDGSAVTQPVSAASLPLPAGAGTSALQTTANTSLASIDTKVGNAIVAGTATIGAVGFDPSLGKATPTENFLLLPATTTTQIIALSGTKITYVTLAKVFAGGTVNVTFKYGTGVNCGTGTTTLEGPYPLTAQVGYVEGNGAGPVMIVPSGQALCVTTDASVSGGIKLISQQF